MNVRGTWAGLMLATLMVVGGGEVAQAGTAANDLMAWKDSRNFATGLKIGGAYSVEKLRAGGTWASFVSVRDSDGTMRPVVSDQADREMYAYSVNKIAVAVAVLDKVDRGELKLTDTTTLTPDIIAVGSGLYQLQPTYGDQLSVANLVTTMLLVSDNTAVRLLGRMVPGPEINATLKSKGFTKTHVDPFPDNPNRFYLGQTTPAEMNSMLEQLATGKLLSPSSTNFVLGVMRWVNGYNDGVRRNMSSEERTRVASKYGAFEDSRHEAGIMFDVNGKPQLVYAFFTEGIGDIGNYGSTNPAVEAQARLGRVMFDALVPVQKAVSQ